MFNRIRVVTMLMMVLGVFALLALVLGVCCSSLQHNQQGLLFLTVRRLIEAYVLHGT